MLYTYWTPLLQFECKKTMRGKFSPSNYCFIAARLKFNYLHLVMLLPLNNREQTQLLDGHLVSVIRRHFLP